MKLGLIYRLHCFNFDTDIVKACIVLHNICIECNDQMPAGSDLTVDPATNKRRDREKVRRLLKMRDCRKIQDTNKKAEEIRSALTKKCWNEKEEHGVI